MTRACAEHAKQTRTEAPQQCGASPKQRLLEQLLRSSARRNIMLHYAVVFLVIALIAGLFGFGIIASTAAGVAKILFLVFLVLFLVTLLRGRRLV